MTASDRNELRKIFFESWRKQCEKIPLEPIESQLVAIMLLHPEYHHFLTKPDLYQEKDFDNDNPFLHMSLHLGLREQISTNRPQGIRLIFQELCEKMTDPHAAEHTMMTCLARILWEGQQTGIMVDENTYLTQLKQLLGKTS